jgi:hypothetical protein
MGSVYGHEFVLVLAAAEILLSLTVSGRILDAISNPRGSIVWIRRDVFDLCGVYHGYHRGFSTSLNKAEFIGGCSLRDAMYKIAVKVAFRMLLLALAATEAWRENGGQPFDGSDVPALVVASCAGFLAAYLVCFGLRWVLFKRRKHQVSERDRTMHLDAAAVPLFDGADPLFLERLSQEMVDCSFEAPPLPPSRANWTRLVPPSVLTGHVSSLLPY